MNKKIYSFFFLKVQVLSTQRTDSTPWEQQHCMPTRVLWEFFDIAKKQTAWNHWRWKERDGEMDSDIVGSDSVAKIVVFWSCCTHEQWTLSARCSTRTQWYKTQRLDQGRDDLILSIKIVLVWACLYRLQRDRSSWDVWYIVANAL